MKDDQIRAAVVFHWELWAAGDLQAEHDNYADDSVCEYPQSGERIVGRANLHALRGHHPGKPSGFEVKRILGSGDLWTTACVITYHGHPTYTVSTMKFLDGKVGHKTQHFAHAFDASLWPDQWVQRTR
jgi:hypothetical protein